MNEPNGQQLPPGWTAAEFAEVTHIVMGQSPPSPTYNVTGQGLPFFQGKAEFGALYPDTRVWCSRPNKVAEADDILLSVRAPVGPTNLTPARCCIGRGLAALRPEAGLNLKYLLYVFRRFAAEMDARGTGTTFKAVSGKVVREFPIPIAPPAEQSRIADALDELLSDLDAGVAALGRVREKLKLYRASVLKAAVGGTLTAEWRNWHPQVEHASEPLKRILAERRRRWEEDQLPGSRPRSPCRAPVSKARTAR
jgi:type I restriction enzyme, S subunit